MIHIEYMQNSNLHVVMLNPSTNIFLSPRGTDLTVPFIHYVFAELTLVVCLVLAYLCFHKIRHISKTGTLYRFAYSCLGGTSIIFAFAPLLGEWPGWSGLVFAISITLLVYSSNHKES